MFLKLKKYFSSLKIKVTGVKKKYTYDYKRCTYSNNTCRRIIEFKFNFRREFIGSLLYQTLGSFLFYLFFVISIIKCLHIDTKQLVNFYQRLNNYASTAFGF